MTGELIYSVDKTRRPSGEDGLTNTSHRVKSAAISSQASTADYRFKGPRLFGSWWSDRIRARRSEQVAGLSPGVGIIRQGRGERACRRRAKSQAETPALLHSVQAGTLRRGYGASSWAGSALSRDPIENDQAAILCAPADPHAVERAIAEDERRHEECPGNACVRAPPLVAAGFTASSTDSSPKPRSAKPLGWAAPAAW